MITPLTMIRMKNNPAEVVPAGLFFLKSPIRLRQLRDQLLGTSKNYPFGF